VKKFPEGLIDGVIPANFISATERKKIVHYDAILDKNYQDNSKTNSFTSNDLDRLNFFLDNSLLLNDTSSRLSRSSNNSDRKSTYSAASNLSKASSIHSQPWKPT
jgi:hypothetical protein